MDPPDKPGTAIFKDQLKTANLLASCGIPCHSGVSNYSSTDARADKTAAKTVDRKPKEEGTETWPARGAGNLDYGALARRT